MAKTDYVANNDDAFVAQMVAFIRRLEQPRQHHRWRMSTRSAEAVWSAEANSDELPLFFQKRVRELRRS